MLYNPEKIELQSDLSGLLNGRCGLPGFAEKLKNGGPVRIGFLGGSITLAEGYRVLVTEQLAKRYPQCQITGINGGIGGTGSRLGVFRLYDDILRHNPDLVFVEFAVNDCANTTQPQCLASMESIIRQIRQFSPDVNICFIYTINTEIRKALSEGKQPWTIQIMEKLADHYGIPSINLGPEVVRQEKSGSLVYQLPLNSEAEKQAKDAGKLVFSNDSTHPTLDDGHGLYSKIIMTALEKILSGQFEKLPEVLPEALSSTAPDNTRMVRLDAAELSSHWLETTPEKENFTRIESIKRLAKIWKTNEPGAEIRFRFKGTGFGLFGLFGLNSGQFKVWIDGVEQPELPLFDMYGNRYRVHYGIVTDSLPYGEHKVIMQLDSQPPDRSILLPSRPIDDPAKLEGLVAYLGSLLINGKLLHN